MPKLLCGLIVSLVLACVPVTAAGATADTAVKHRAVKHSASTSGRRQEAARRAAAKRAAVRKRAQARKRAEERRARAEKTATASKVTVRAMAGSATPASEVIGATRPATSTTSVGSAPTQATNTPTTVTSSPAPLSPGPTATAPISASTATAAAPAAGETTAAATAAAAAATTSATTTTATTATPASPSSPVLGTFGISTTQQAAAWKADGGNAEVIEVAWQAAQPTQDGPVSLANAGNDGGDVVTQIEDAEQNGLAVYLELDLQYPPSWVLSGVPEFVDQNGNSWSQPTLAGQDVRDWIWSASGRQAVASFVNGAMADLAPYLSEISGIRAGGGVYGELDFPTQVAADGTPSFWGYDSAAQTGTGLAEGESATPLPGYVYGTGTAAQDTEWSNWYLGSLASWITWYAQLLRSDGWTGPTYVLSPSYGMRTNMTARSIPYEQQLAWGDDWGVMMDSYDQVPNVWPWSTWADDTEPFYTPGDTVDSDAAAWRKLLELAQARGLASHIMGENTGGGGVAAIHQLMSGALAAGYTGVFYLNYSSLVADGLTSDLVSQFDTYAGQSAT